MAACKLDKATCREPQAVPHRSCALSRLWHAILWVNMFHVLKNYVHKMKEFELGSILRGSRREQELGMWVRPNCFGYPCGRTVTCPPHSPSLLGSSPTGGDSSPLCLHLYLSGDICLPQLRLSCLLTHGCQSTCSSFHVLRTSLSDLLTSAPTQG